MDIASSRTSDSLFQEIHPSSGSRTIHLRAQDPAIAASPVLWYGLLVAITTTNAFYRDTSHVPLLPSLSPVLAMAHFIVDYDNSKGPDSKPMESSVSVCGAKYQTHPLFCRPSNAPKVLMSAQLCLWFLRARQGTITKIGWARGVEMTDKRQKDRLANNRYAHMVLV
ncbi:hypothetical protein BOTBODRAFT_32302 [Botryobasidium botryosum FD-172 SS1]|uniref:Uncharacterized protein n=1 Tax=Botryobasidium botryosum (strain FD-172 SS1) TaxID=930990 RepID=A0A067MTQ7_BOTB1|nr:hypothetical protein BOTBODRAFT_32302 [Botryobasidium botryosum FD-172 SS1]